ncbi:MAG: immunity 49 family protein [Bacillaceae bacterium]|nr:immunity 49 family protein [Bacillaceae bacterium]
MLDKEKLKKLGEEHKELLKEDISQIEQNQVLKKFMSLASASVSSKFEVIAIVDYLLYSNPINSKIHFYYSAKIRERLLHWYDHPDRGISVDHSFVGSGQFDDIYKALISDHETLIQSYARLIGGRPEAEKEHGTTLGINLDHVLKYLILDENDKAEPHVKTLGEIKEQKQVKPYVGQIIALQGIFEGDQAIFHEGLQRMIERHRKRREYKLTPLEQFSIPIVGMAKLGMRKGLAIGIDDPLLPEEMLQKHDIDYPELALLKRFEC